jgi:hypothetical protein
MHRRGSHERLWQTPLRASGCWELIGNTVPMTRIVNQWQDQFGHWQRFQEKHNQADAYRTAQARARSTGKRHRLVDEGGRLLDLLEP